MVMTARVSQKPTAERLIECWSLSSLPMTIRHWSLIRRLESKRLLTRPVARDVALRELRDREVLNALMVAFQPREEA